MSQFFPFIDRCAQGGWPDGITPGFVELGIAPATSPGFQCPIGSIAKVGTAYYQKVGTAATSWRILGAGTSDYRRYRPSTYNLGAVAGASTARMSGASIAAPQNRLWCFPVPFARAGTLTTIAFETFQGAVVRSWYPFVYRMSATLMVPGALAFTQLVTMTDIGPPGIAATQVLTPNLTVDEGEILFLGLLGDANAFAASSLSVVASSVVEPLPGMNFTAHAVATAGDYSLAVGYRHAFAFASPPATYPGGGSPTVINSNTDGDCPVLFFQFTEG